VIGSRKPEKTKNTGGERSGEKGGRDSASVEKRTKKDKQPRDPKGRRKEQGKKSNATGA